MGKCRRLISVCLLKRDHSSYPRNSNIANVFFKAGYIESWGRGTNKIIEACIDADLPEPVIEEEQGGFSITFLKDIYTEKFFRKQDLEERQINALLFIKEHRNITNAQYQKLTNVSKRTATRDLLELIGKKVLFKNPAQPEKELSISFARERHRGHKGAKGAI